MTTPALQNNLTPNNKELTQTVEQGGVYCIKVNDIDAVFFSPSHWMQLFVNRKNDLLCQEFFRVLAQFQVFKFETLTDDIKNTIDLCVGTMLNIIVQPEFSFTDQDYIPILTKGQPFWQLVYLSTYQTTDPWIETLLRRDDSYAKLLFLYSPFNRIRLNLKELFDTSPFLASIWWGISWASPSYRDQHTYTSMVNLLNEFDDRFMSLDVGVIQSYFHTTYLNVPGERTFKSKLHKMIRSTVENVVIKNTPSKNSIAVITSKWIPHNVVYKCLYPLLASLKSHYRLTLVHLQEDFDLMETSLFDTTINCKDINDAVTRPELTNNDFTAAIFPDIGMNIESLVFSNLRIAPIQISCYGHPASTYGALIDYFIGGDGVELKEKAAQNYSERLVVIPGSGVHSVLHEYPQMPSTPSNTDLHIINLMCSPSKLNHPFLETLKEIRSQSKKQILFRFMIGVASANLEFHTLVKQLQSIFGSDGCDVMTGQPYLLYMNILGLGSFTLDAYPFGGYNTVIDSIRIAKPIITRKGDKAFNRLASALLHSIGLDELIAESREEYIQKALLLINEDDYRLSISEKMRKIDLNGKLDCSTNPIYFKKAIDYLIENHSVLQSENSTAPIVIC